MSSTGRTQGVPHSIRAYTLVQLSQLRFWNIRHNTFAAFRTLIHSPSDGSGVFGEVRSRHCMEPANEDVEGWVASKDSLRLVISTSNLNRYSKLSSRFFRVNTDFLDKEWQHPLKSVLLWLVPRNLTSWGPIWIFHRLPSVSVCLYIYRKGIERHPESSCTSMIGRRQRQIRGIWTPSKRIL
ncbi:hypothetical protein BDN72DRAFT_959575 [Pluteus cervinus]|uniref:Uncharacterized protein n=1 Tax=Pluteus cervinus TaxID=181527 RepID=A0ACD3AVS8_9AGAR|nr:hypothetical protein BDN72DRAFT_959575 [Pluteus cervinus]